MFDEQPDGDQHGECAAEIHRLEAEVASLRAALAQQAAVPAAPDAVVELPPLPREPAAHMYPSDLEKFRTAETFATTYSVAVGCPDERSEPLFNTEQMQAYARTALQAVPQAGGLSDAEIDKMILASPAEGYSMLCSMRHDMKVTEFTAVARNFARAILARAGAVEGGR